MNNWPTVNRPLRLTAVGNIPAMKNRRVPFLGTTAHGEPFVGIRKDAAVVRAMMNIASTFGAQFASSGFDTIPLPHRVGVYALIYKQGTRSGAPPRSDLDNQYTTLQELLAPAGVIEDDRQVAAYCVEECLVSLRASQRAELTVFLLDKGEPFVVQLSQLVKRIALDRIVHPIPNALEGSDQS